MHHARARRYWEAEAVPTIAFCRVTALALLRHLTNRHIMQHSVLNARGAWQAYDTWRALPEVVLLADPAGIDTHLKRLSDAANLTSKVWTDAYLAAFAQAGDLRLVAFDRDFNRFPGLDLLLLDA